MADRLPSQGNYWWSEIDNTLGGDYRWRPVLQMEGSCMSVDTIHFRSKEDCDQFIKDEILGADWDA